MATSQRSSSAPASSQTFSSPSGPVPTPFPIEKTNRVRKISSSLKKKSNGSLKENHKPSSTIPPFDPSLLSSQSTYADSIDERTPLLPSSSKSKSPKPKTTSLTQDQRDRILTKAFNEGGVEKMKRVKEILDKDAMLSEEIGRIGF